ncbi:MAG TPA: carboxylesterase family protein [Kofleriaceae bacterium]|nr:carboxylesterase family protein [Kofleriaceae bacterium]
MRNFWLIAIVAACGSHSNGSGSDAASPDSSSTIDGATCGTPSPGAPAEHVVTTGGSVHGAVSSTGMSYVYYDIPFAQPPVGSARFTAPAAATCATAEIDGTTEGPICAQLGSDATTIEGSEDCLQLNVWAPVSATTARPVMVYVHGGANAAGSATDPLFDGRMLAESYGVLVVTINYRLGQLGFLASTAFASEGVGNGDFGLLDQILALQWVQQNIAGFGGDPSNVTVFGESAGGRDVCSLVATPMAAGLFARAIMESGSCSALPTLTAAEATGAAYVTAAGCAATSDVASCLRALPLATAIQTNAPDPSILVSTLYQPAIDGSVQPTQPVTAIAAGTHNGSAFIIGANADETGAAVPAVPDGSAYEALVDEQFGSADGAKVLAQYPAANYATPRAAYVQVTTDSRFVCPSREFARASLAGGLATYRYLFAYAPTPVGAVHGIELPFVFGNFGAITGANGNPYQPTTTDLAVSAATQADWVSFASGGAPTGTPAWPLYTSADPAREYDATPTVVTGIRTANCDFWQTLESASL